MFRNRRLPISLLPLLVALAFIAVQASPDLFFTDFEPFQRQPVIRQFSALLPLAFLSDCSLVVAETLLLILGFAWLSGRSRGGTSPARRIGLAALLVVTAGYFAVLYTSWALYTQSRVFLKLEDLRLLTYLLDLEALVPLVSEQDILVGATLLVASSASAGIVLYLGKRLRRTRLACAAMSIALVLPCILFVQVESLEPRLRQNGNTVLGHLVSPRLTLLVSLFRAPASAPASPVIEGQPVASDFEIAAAQARSAPRPNLLVLVVEALRADILERSDVMPFSSELAAHGVSFRRVFTQAADTGASEEAILTGLYPLKFPYRDLHFDVGYPHVLIYEALAKAGYRTSLFANEWAETRRLTESSALNLHFDPKFLLEHNLSSIRREQYTLQQSDSLAVKRLESWIKSTPPGVPWFSYLYLGSSHFPYDCAPRPGGVDEPEAQTASYFGYPDALVPVMRGRYERCLGFIDGLTRHLFEFLRAQGLDQNTMVVLTGDHGEHFGEQGLVAHSKRLFAKAIEVPLVLTGIPKNATTVDPAVAVAGHIDIAPTLLAAAGLPPHPLHQGRSLISTALNHPRSSEEPLFSSTQLWNQEDAVVVWPWKYVASYSGDAPTLFNLEEDPDELHERSSTEPSVAARMSELTGIYRASQLQHYGRTGAARRGAAPPQYTLEALAQARAK